MRQPTKQLIASLVVACGFAMGVHAQDKTIQSKTEIKGDEGKTITYTGCVGSGTESRSFVLNHVVPIDRSTSTQVGTTGTAGTTMTTTTTTTYTLVPEEKVELQPHLGHKVEVTGRMQGGDSKTTTETKTERDHEPDTKTTETRKTEGGAPEFHVISIKELADSCM